MWIFSKNRGHGPAPLDLSKHARQIRLALKPVRYENEMFNFENVDGETVFLRAHDIPMIKILLSVIQPDLLDNEDETED